MKIWVIALVTFCALLGAFSQVMLKIGVDKFQFAYEHIIRNLPLITGVSLYVLAFILYNFALRFENVTILYPLIASSYIFVVFFAYILLNEAITTKKIIGSFVIVAGIWLIAGG